MFTTGVHTLSTDTVNHSQHFLGKLATMNVNNVNNVYRERRNTNRKTHTVYIVQCIFLEYKANSNLKIHTYITCPANSTHRIYTRE